MTIALVVSTDAKMLEDLKEILSRSNIQVTHASSAQEGSEKVRAEPPDVVLTENGDTLTIVARVVQSYVPYVPVICCLYKRDSDQAVKALRRGAYECVAPHKPGEPLDDTDVVSAVRHAIVRFARVARPAVEEKVRTRPSLLLLRYRWSLIMAGILVVFLGGLIHQMVQPRIGEEFYRLMTSHPTGISYDGKDLWVCDWHDQALSRYRVGETFSRIARYEISDFFPLSVATGEDVLWTISEDSKIRRHLNDDFLTVVVEVDAPGSNPTAIAYDGENLWTIDADKKKLYQHDPDNMSKILFSYDLPMVAPVGIAWVGDRLWVSEALDQTVWRYKLHRDRLIQDGKILLPLFKRDPNLPLSGLTSDGLSLWTVSEATEKGTGGVLARHILPD